MADETKSQEDNKEEPKVFDADYVKELRNEAAAARVKNKELAEKLDAITKQIETEKETKLKEQNEFKSLYEGLKTKYDPLEAENKTLKEQLQTIEDESRKELLERFPKEKLDVVKDLPIEKLRALAKLETTAGAKTDKSRGVATLTTKTEAAPKSFDEWADRAKEKGLVS